MAFARPSSFGHDESCRRRSPYVHAFAIVLVLLAVAWPRRAWSWTYRLPEDNMVAAWDLRTGELLWSYAPERLSFGELELRSGRLVVTPHVGYERRPVVYLEPKTGKPAAEPPSSTPSNLDPASVPTAPLKLENGWELVGFRPGYGKELTFQASTGRKVWTLKLPTFPHSVAAWQNTVFWAAGPYDGELVVCAHDAGQAAPKWTFSPREVLAYPRERWEAALLVLEDDLYVGVRQYLFSLDPSAGTVRFRRDLAVATGIAFRGSEEAFFRGGIGEPQLIGDTTTLAVVYEGRVVAIDRAKQSVLWHRDPAFLRPVPQHPLVSDGVLYLTTGRARAPDPPQGEALAVHPDSQAAKARVGELRPPGRCCMCQQPGLGTTKANAYAVLAAGLLAAAGGLRALRRRSQPRPPHMSTMRVLRGGTRARLSRIPAIRAHGCALLLAGCSAGGAGQARETAAHASPAMSDLPSANGAPSAARYGKLGSCRVLRECFEARDRDEDGCPDYVVPFAVSSAVLSSEAKIVLEQVVEEIRELELLDLGLIGITAAQEPPNLALARATVVKDWLQDHGTTGVAFHLNASRNREPAVRFEPSCSHTSCRPPRAPAKPWPFVPDQTYP